MAVPTIAAITPNAGPAGGRRIITVTGTGFNTSTTSGKTLLLEVDGITVPFEKLGVTSDTELHFELPAYRGKGVTALADILGAVDVKITNIDGNEDPIPGEEVTAVAAFTYVRDSIRNPEATEENQCYRAVIVEVIETFARQVLANTAIGTSVDYGEFGSISAMDAKLPAIALVGPRFGENFEVRHQWADLPADALGGTPELFATRWPAFVTDLEFDMVIGANRRRETYALVQAVTRMFQRTPWIEIPVTPGDQSGPRHQFPLHLLSAPNISFQEMNSDLITASGLFQVRWVPDRLPDGSALNYSVIDGQLQIVDPNDPNVVIEVVPFAHED